MRNHCASDMVSARSDDVQIAFAAKGNAHKNSSAVGHLTMRRIQLGINEGCIDQLFFRGCRGCLYLQLCAPTIMPDPYTSGPFVSNAWVTIAPNNARLLLTLAAVVQDTQVVHSVIISRPARGT